ncbi:MAG: hypothetical protein ACYTJ0_17860 [Planctomycetota bacterium]|jgi:hypothetical protein
MAEPLTCTILPDSTVLSCSAAAATRLGLAPEELVGRRLVELRAATRAHCVQYLKRMTRLTLERPSCSARIVVEQGPRVAHFITLSATGTFGPDGRLLLLRLVCEPADIVTCVDRRPLPVRRTWRERCRPLQRTHGAAVATALSVFLFLVAMQVPTAPVRRAIGWVHRLAPSASDASQTVFRGGLSPREFLQLAPGKREGRIPQLATDTSRGKNSPRRTR